jgi:hypothetical protein
MLIFGFLPRASRRMKISAFFSFWMGIVFTLLTLGMAISNLMAGSAHDDASTLADARGYAMFWFFLAGFGLVMIVVSWLMMKGRLGGDQE